MLLFTCLRSIIADFFLSIFLCRRRRWTGIASEKVKPKLFFLWIKCYFFEKFGWLSFFFHPKNFQNWLIHVFKFWKVFQKPSLAHRCREWHGQLADSLNNVMNICRVAVVCQLLEGQQKLVCFNCRRGVFTAELRLTGKTVFLLLVWKCTRGAVGDFFLNSCHHVVSVVWTRFCSQTPRDTASGWWSFCDLSSFVPWFVRSVLWDVSGVVPEWPWIRGFRRNSCRKDRPPKMRLSVLLHSRDNFFVNLHSISSKTWVLYNSCDPGTFGFCAKIFRGYSSQISFLRAASFCFLLKVALFYWKSNEQ